MVNLDCAVACNRLPVLRNSSFVLIAPRIFQEQNIISTKDCIFREKPDAGISVTYAV